MIHVESNGIRERRNEIHARVMQSHYLASGEDASVRPVMIRVRERTGRVVDPDRPKARGPYVEQWIVTYRNGKSRTYERLEPIVSEETP